MRLDKILIGLGMFLLVITAGTYIMFSEDPVTKKSYYEFYDIVVNDTKFNLLPDNYSKIYEVSSEEKTAITEQDIDVDTGWESMLTGGYSALKTFLKSFSIAGEIIMGVGLAIGIPVFFLEFAAICFMIVVIFTIIYMLFRFMPRD